jgi:hypothetical protein
MIRQSQNITMRKVEALPCFLEVRRRLRQGEPALTLARELQSRGFMTDVALDAVRIRLGTYRRLKLQNAAIIALHAPKSVQEKLKGLEMALDELVEMEEMFKLQKERIRAFRETEKAMPIPIKQIDDSMRVALEIVGAHAELRMELGELDRAPTKVDLNVDTKTMMLVENRYGKESLQRVLADPKKRSKVAGIVEKLLMNPRLQSSALSALEGIHAPAATVVSADDDDVVDAPQAIAEPPAQPEK